MDDAPETFIGESPYLEAANEMLVLFKTLNAKYLQDAPDHSFENVEMLAEALELADIEKRRSELLGKIERRDVINKICWTGSTASALRHHAEPPLTPEDSALLDAALARVQVIQDFLPDLSAVDRAMRTLQTEVNNLMGRREPAAHAPETAPEL